MKKLFTITNSIIFINILVFILCSIYKNFYLFFGLNIYFTKANLWYQPLTTMFIHGNLLHLLMNMSVLYQLGEGFQKYFGRKIFLGLYFIGGIITSILSYYFMSELYFIRGIYPNVIGASGALCVLLGFYSYFDKRQRNQIITMIILISFVPLLFGIGVAWYVHIIGFALGFCVAYIKKGYKCKPY